MTGRLQPIVERITDLAADRLDVPLASVNVITEHDQEFLACHGADWTPTAREDSVCTYAIVEDDDVTVIEDLRDDPRFEHNEAIRDLGIRFYASATLATPDGLPLGTLCVYDDAPRTLDADERAALRTLADLAEDVLDLNRRLADARDGAEEGA